MKPIHCMEEDIPGMKEEYPYTAGGINLKREILELCFKANKLNGTVFMEHGSMSSSDIMNNATWQIMKTAHYTYCLILSCSTYVLAKNGPEY